MEPSLLVQNEEKRLNIPMPLLFCFAMFPAWQMGIIYYSGQTLSFYGKTLLPEKIMLIVFMLHFSVFQF